jgi:hypothetical protein
MGGVAAAAKIAEKIGAREIGKMTLPPVKPKNLAAREWGPSLNRRRRQYFTQPQKSPY